MVVHPAAGNENGTLVNALMYHCQGRLSSINGVIRPGIVHRIDKDTSGLLVVAKNDTAHECLSAQLAEHTIVRRYEALVFNNLSEEEGTIDEPIGRNPSSRIRQTVIHGGGNARNAVTHWKVLTRFGRYTLIEARLETGKDTSDKSHMSYIKHPLVGDMVYGPKKQPFNISGQLLTLKCWDSYIRLHRPLWVRKPPGIRRCYKKLESNLWKRSTMQRSNEEKNTPFEKTALKPGTLLSPVPAVMVSCGRDEEKNI